MTITISPPFSEDIAACRSGSAYLWRSQSGEWRCARKVYLTAEESLPGASGNPSRYFGKVKKFLHWQELPMGSNDLTVEQRQDFASTIDAWGNLSGHQAPMRWSTEAKAYIPDCSGEDMMPVTDGNAP